MRISDVLRDKGDRVVTVTPDLTVQGLLATLAEHGAAVLTEPVSAIQTTRVHTVGPDADIAEIEHLMTERRFRHVPVVSGGRLAGIVSIGDVVKKRITELEVETSALSGYITGERP